MAAHPDTTTLFAAVSPAFRQALRNRLLERLTEHQIPEAIERSLEQVPGGASSQEQIAAEVIHSDLLPPSSYRDPDAEAIQSDPELRALATHLDETAPFATIDPAFRQRLRTQLASTLSKLYYSSLEDLMVWLYSTYKGEVLQLVSAEDETIFLTKARPLLREKPSCELALTAPLTRHIASAIGGLGLYTELLDLSHLTHRERAVPEQVLLIRLGALRFYDQVARESGYLQAFQAVCEVLVNNLFSFIIHASSALGNDVRGGRETKERVLGHESVNLLHVPTCLPNHGRNHGLDYNSTFLEGFSKGAWKRLTGNLIQGEKQAYSIKLILQMLACIWQYMYLSLRTLFYRNSPVTALADALHTWQTTTNHDLQKWSATSIPKLERENQTSLEALESSSRL